MDADIGREDCWKRNYGVPRGVASMILIKLLVNDTVDNSEDKHCYVSIPSLDNAIKQRPLFSSKTLWPFISTLEPLPHHSLIESNE
jgi:hypothetical protein